MATPCTCVRDKIKSGIKGQPRFEFETGFQEKAAFGLGQNNEVTA